MSSQTAIARLNRVLNVLLIAAMLIMPLASARPVMAAESLTIIPLTWNVVGLDSNNVDVGPNTFPVGARVCNTGASTLAKVTATFSWTSTATYINTRTGSLTELSVSNLSNSAPNNCQDFYFEVEVTRNAAAYDTTRRYEITAVGENPLGTQVATATTPTPREIYVEHLISQNRNSVNNVYLGEAPTWTPVPAGGSMSLMVGKTYKITLEGGTATQGYNQFESFINFPNTIFQVLSVTTDYAASSNPLLIPFTNYPYLYADACGWDNDPNSPNYRSCIVSDDKAGGAPVFTTYTLKILSGAGTSQTLNTLLYDFSGSSYHYNSDYSSAPRIAVITDPSSIKLNKSFDPKSILVDNSTTLTFTIPNPTAEEITGVNFSDTLPTGVAVYATPSINIQNCGTGTLTDALSGGVTPVGGTTFLYFSGGTIAPNSTCTISLKVTASTTGTFVNTTTNLFINETVDTGNKGTDTLKASAVEGCTPQPMVQWTFTNVTSVTQPNYDAGKDPLVSSAVLSFVGGTESIATTTGSPTANAWSGDGFVKNAVNTSSSQPYFQIAVDSALFTNVQLKLRSYATANWGTSNLLKVYSSADGGGTFSDVNLAGSLVKTTWSPDQLFPAVATGPETTIFRINADGANPTGAAMMLDNILVEGCRTTVLEPNFGKAFNPDIIKLGDTSTLTFTIGNLAADPLTEVTFTDILPDGLAVSSGSAAVCGGTVTTTAPKTIALSGATIPVEGSCIFDITVTGTGQGDHQNVSGFLSSKETGTTTKYATSSVNVIAPPVLAKSFSPASIYTGQTTQLTFTFTNPNPTTTLTNVTFTDTLPANLTVASGTATITCQGSGWTTANVVVTAPNLIELTAPTPPAFLSAGAICSFTVEVTATKAQNSLSEPYTNTTGTITSTNGGDGNQATAKLIVLDRTPRIEINKQVSTSATGPWVKSLGVLLPAQIYYRFTLYNAGDVDFTSYAITDQNLVLPTWDSTNCKLELPPQTQNPNKPVNGLPVLAVGDTVYCIAGPYTAVTGLHPNTAKATGDYLEGQTLNHIDSANSTAEYGTMAISIVKSVTEKLLPAAGQPLHYSFKVTNSGFAALTGPVWVVDDKIGTVSCPDLTTVGDLDEYFDVGEQVTCTATYIVTAADILAGKVTNVASAKVGNGNVESPLTSQEASLTVNKILYVFLPIINTPPIVITTDATVGYEDMPLLPNRNDYDYNDWNVNLRTVATLVGSQGSTRVSKLNVTVTPQARGASFDHQFQLVFPAALLGNGGSMTLALYDQNHNLISTKTSTFVGGANLPVEIFGHTSSVFTLFKANVYEAFPVKAPLQTAELSMVFNAPLPTDLKDIQVSGTNLLFDPTLNVLDTGDVIHNGDIRMIVVPVANWQWPEEGVRIDKVYPLVGFAAGTPPVITFPANWWTVHNNCVVDGLVCVQP